MEIEQPLKFWAGQYVDITVPGKGITRSFSMANPPSEPNRLQFIIKKYGQGAFSSLLDGGLKVGRQPDAARSLRHLFAAREPDRAAGAGGRRLRHVAAVVDPSGPDRLRRTGRPIRFFYGARQARDLFYLDRFAELAKKLPDFRFIPALSDAAPGG